MKNALLDTHASQEPANQPPTEQLAARLAALSPEKQALLALRLKKKLENTAGAAQSTSSNLPIQPRPDQTRYPLSHAQQRLWFLNQFEPDSPYYNVSAALRIRGPLDIAAFEHSLNVILERHEILRARFMIREGLPVQIIAPHLTLSLPLTDLSHLPSTEQDDAFRSAADLELRQPFDLQHGPLLRARLLRLGVDTHILLLTIHHIVYDGWSTKILIQELSTLYTHFKNAARECAAPGEAVLAELPLQYADYAYWQNDYLQSQAIQAQMRYWEGQLQPAPPVLELPSDRPRPSVLSHRGAHHVFDVPTELYKKLLQLCRSENVTLFMALLAAFEMLLYRYTRQTDFGVGVPVANRTRREWENLIGFFVNTLVMRAQIADEDSFRSLLARTQKTALGAFSHQEVPFEMLVDRFQPQRDMSRSPLFQVMFDLQEDALERLSLDDLQIELLEYESGAAKFDLMLMMAVSSQGLRGAFEYNTDLFDATTIQRMTGHLLTLLSSLASNPDQPISTLPMLTPDELHLLLETWNDTTLEYPAEQTWQAAFEAQAERTPDAPAVVYEDELLTYRQLNQRANCIAHALARRGVGAESVVGLYCERGVDLVAGVLGILKAGGAYLPLDPSYPDERLAYMVEDARVDLIITQKCTLEESVPWQAQLLPVEDIYHQALASDHENPALRSAPDNLAYVIYTSGSTGKPKGVQITHRSAMHLAAALHQRIYASHTRSHLRISLNAPLSFDASVQQLVMLTHGHTLVIIPQAIRLDGPALLDYIRCQRIDGFDCVPSQLKLLLAAGLLESDWVPSILMPGGEAIDPATWERLAQATNIEVYNMYGPTECTVDSTIGWVRMSPGRPTIGRPVANARLYILDSHQQPVPVGVPGELYIGGAGVGRGYMNQPELTHQRFIPDRFSNTPQARLYRTGDLARYLPDGNVEFLGRIDHQVKVHGHRIELGEIEAALKEHPAIQDAAVLLREDLPGEQRLVAYFISDQQAIPSTAELRAHLRQKLPAYMIPNLFLLQENFPLTPNGKVDRKAFPAPDRHRSLTEQPGLAPRNALERLLVEKWRQVLHCEQIGIQDNFFELGGDSIQAAVLANQLQDALGQKVNVRMLFTFPTVMELAANLVKDFPALSSLNSTDSSLAGKAAANFPPLQPSAEKVLSFAQQRLWFLEHMQPGSPLYNIAGAVRIRGLLDLPALTQAIHGVIARHDTLRTRFETVDGKPVVIVEPEIEVPIPVTDLTNLALPDAEQKALSLAEEQARQPFNLSVAPLLRMHIYRLSEQDYLATLVLHHMIADGWSIGVFVREMAACYRLAQHSVSSMLDTLPLLPVQYTDYAFWQRKWLEGEPGAESPMESQLAYWRSQLAGLPPVLELPTDQPRPAEMSYKGDLVHFVLPASLSWKLKELSQAEGVTLFAVLMAAWQALLSRYSGQEDIAVGFPVAGRNRSELENLIGFFVNTLVLRTDFSGEPSFLQVLHRVHQAISEAHAHQDVPFEMLVNELQPQRDLSHSPLFQAMFAFQNTPDQTLHLPGVQLETIPLSSGTAKFDLTLSMQDQGGALRGSLEYSTDLFRPKTIQRMLRRFEKLLQELCADPNGSVFRVPLLLEDERQALFSAWNETTAPYPANQTLHQLFEAQVERSPHACALQFQSDEISYQQLNAQANQLAHYLLHLGVATDQIVALRLENPVERIVSMLAVLKAGGAYLPLSPHTPLQRLEFILQDAGARILITSSRLAAQLDASPGLRAALQQVCLDLEQAEISQHSTSNPGRLVEPENLAYVIYTSGSTGLPKGVLIEHGGVCNLASAYIQKFNLGENSRVLSFFDYIFDGSVADIFPALLSGARLSLIADEERLPGAELATIIRQQAITHMVLTPSALSSLPLSAAQYLETIVSAGENCSREVAARWMQARPGIRFFNAYGPTEASVAASWYEVTDLAAFQRSVPIGRPLPNVRIYLLDKHLQPSPPGIPGEIFIAGPGIARGYLNRPELDAERFLPDPFFQNGENHPAGRQRMYRSGDLARMRPDGNLEFMGRADQQVKVRGFRIEPGEIEAALLSFPGILECAVTVHTPQAVDGMPASQRLVAYLVSQAQPAPDPRDLNRYLRGMLPEYMIPAAYVYLDQMPRTPSNKIDRKALPEPASRAALDGWDIPGNEFQAPRDAKETLLADIWSQLLGLEQVSVNDNFFELGGDSILAIQVVSRAAKAGLNLTPRQVFQYPTIAQLARVGRDIAAQESVEEPGAQEPAPLTPVQAWFFEQQLPEPQHWNQTVLLQVHQRLDPLILKETVKQLIAQHPTIGLRFERNPHGWQQSLADVQVDQVFHWHDLSALPAASQRASVEQHSASYQSSLDLSNGPLLRIVYFDLGPDQPARLLLVAHHLVIDGVSWRILLEDMQTIYHHLEQHSTPPRLPPSVSYLQWAKQLSEAARSSWLQDQLPYWLEISRRQAPHLPLDDPNGANTEETASSILVELTPEETHLLLRLVPELYGADIQDAILAALAQAYAEWSNGRELLLDLEHHGREAFLDDLDLSRTVGWFTSIFPVRFELHNLDDPGYALKSIKEQLRRVPQKGLGFGLLRYLHPEWKTEFSRSPGLKPLISFNYLGQFDSLFSQQGTFSLAPEQAGPARSPKSHRPHLISLNGGIYQNRLRIEWTFSRAVHKPETIAWLTERFLERMREIVRACQQKQDVEYTPADFQDIDLSDGEIDALLREIGSSGS